MERSGRKSGQRRRGMLKLFSLPIRVKSYAKGKHRQAHSHCQQPEIAAQEPSETREPYVENAQEIDEREDEQREETTTSQQLTTQTHKEILQLSSLLETDPNTMVSIEELGLELPLPEFLVGCTQALTSLVGLSFRWNAVQTPGRVLLRGFQPVLVPYDSNPFPLAIKSQDEDDDILAEELNSSGNKQESSPLLDWLPSWLIEGFQFPAATNSLACQCVAPDE